MVTMFQFLVLPEFSTLGLSLLTEPLFLANWLSGRELYRSSICSIDGQPVRTSSGTIQSVDHEIIVENASGPVFVLASFAGKSLLSDRKHRNVLRRLAAFGVELGGIETGSEVLASAGLLDGYRAAIHWQNVRSFHEVYTEVVISDGLFVVDRNRMTSAGALANLQLMLHLIGRDHGDALAREISRHLLVSDSKNITEFQLPSTARHESTTDQRIKDAAAVMLSNLESPLRCPEIAESIGVSQRQMERDFGAHFGMPPNRYYKTLRLNHAHGLLQQTSMSVTEISICAGFVSAEHFSRAYRKQYGIAPSRDRYQVQDALVAWVPDHPGRPD